MSEHIFIPVDAIHPSPTNPRKSFDVAQLNELAASITTHGLVQAVKVRPHPTIRGDYMLVVGERRWRASQIAKIASIPANVEELSETQVLEQQIVENTQRVDVEPLEEASGYQALLDHHSYTMDDLAAKTGRSRAHLYGRLKLLKLAPGPRKALQSGKLSASVAELIARIPVAKLQEEACKVCLGEENGLASTGIHHETLDSEKNDYETQPLSYRAAHALITRKFSLRLDLAKFPTEVVDLVPKAGACGPCPHRSGNQPELPGMASGVADLCTNPPCFESKTQAAWKIAAAAAKDRGLEVVEHKKNDSIFQYDGVTVTSTGPYVDLDTPLPYDLAKQPGSHATFGKLLGKKASEIPRVLVQDESGAPRELLDKRAAVAMLRELGKVDKPEKPKSKDNSPSQKAKFEKQNAKRELGEAALVRVLGDVATGMAEDLGKREVAFWRWLARGVISLVGYGDADIVGARRELKSHDALVEQTDKLRSVCELRGLVAEVLVCLDGIMVHTGFGTPDKETKERFEDGLKLAGASWDDAMTAAKTAAKAEAKSDKAKVAKKAGAK